MTITDLLHRAGTVGLARLVALLALFLLMHAVRAPFVLVARLLSVGMARLDVAVATTVPPLPMPVHHPRPVYPIHAV